MRYLKKFFNNKRVIVTGHTGFKGSWLTFLLYILGAKVIGISKDVPSEPSLYKILNLKKKIIDVKLDIRNLSALKKTLRKYKPNYVFHLAAQSLVNKSYIDPVLTFTTNTIGTMNIMESIRGLKHKCISVIITSDKSYKNLEIKRGYKEEDLLGGKDPYSASKASAELIIKSYIQSYFNLKSNNKYFAIARAGNVIGGGDWSSDRLIPDCVKAWSKKKLVIIRNPNSTRPWQHVFEALRGYIFLIIKLSKNSKLHGEAFNFGPKNSQNKTVAELINEMKKTWKNVLWKKNKNIFLNYESNLLKLNSGKAKKKLKWKPILSFRETISMVTLWYKSFYQPKKNMFEISKIQLIQFFSKSKIL